MKENIFLLVDRSEEDESSGKAIDNCENYSLGLVSKPGGEESNDEAEAQGAAKHNAVPDGLHQLGGQWLLPERFLLGWVGTKFKFKYLYVADLKARKTAKKRTARLKDRMTATGISSSSRRNSGRSQQIFVRFAKVATEFGFGTRWPSSVYVRT